MSAQQLWHVVTGCHAWFPNGKSTEGLTVLFILVRHSRHSLSCLLDKASEPKPVRLSTCAFGLLVSILFAPQICQPLLNRAFQT